MSVSDRTRKIGDSLAAKKAAATIAFQELRTREMTKTLPTMLSSHEDLESLIARVSIRSHGDIESAEVSSGLPQSMAAKSQYLA